MTKRKYESEVEGRKVSERPCTRWINIVTKASIARSLEMRDAKMRYLDSNKWGHFESSMNVEGMTENIDDAK